MSVETTQGKPAYLAHADGTVVLNGAGVEADTRYRAAQADRDRLDRSWVGAVLAGLFLQHAWLDAITLTLEVSPEYDDGGGFYRSTRCQASAPRAVPGQPLPEEVFPEGAFDPDAATSLIEEELEDGMFDLYAGLAEYPEGYSDLTVSLERSAIAALLQHCPVDGSLACIAWGWSVSPPA